MATAEELAARLEALESKLAVPEPVTEPAPKSAEPTETPVYTRTQIRQAVAEGQITEDEGEAIWEQQVERQIERRITERIEERERKMTRDKGIMQEVAKYHAKIPELLVDGSDEGKAVAAEAKRLMDLGVSSDMKLLGLMALKSLYGKADTIAKRAKAEEELESHEEGSSGAGDVETDTTTDDGAPGGLSARQRKHYTKLIDAGVYKDWSAVKEELKFAR
jgi:hypothetical protein